MVINSRNFIIMLVIALVCSITPISAVQIGEQTNNDTFDWNAALSEGVNYAFNFLNSESETELTPEQHAYLEERQELLEYKGDGILNNSQVVLDYLIKEFNKNNETTVNSKKRSMGDDFSDSLITITKHIQDLGYNVSTSSYTYADLKKYANGTTNTTNNTVDNTGTIIVQIKDNDYVRYMELDNITKDDIWLHSPKQASKHYTKAAFESVCMNGENINIILVHPDYERKQVESAIISYQANYLKGRINLYNGLKIAFGVMSTIGGAILAAGIVQLCLNCKRRIQYRDIQLEVEEQVHEGDETTPLITRKKTITKQIRKVVCEKCKRPTGIIGTGLTIITFSISITLFSAYFQHENEIEKDNLDKY